MSELEQDSTERNKELLGRIKWLMVLRLLFATFLLVATVVVQARAYPSFSNISLASLYLLTGVIYFLTLCYALLLDRIKKYILFAYVQLVFDVLFVTALIYVTGGIESIFSLSPEASRAFFRSCTYSQLSMLPSCSTVVEASS
jgi:two-component system sensor histidine kinase PilS (NtrC family)